MKYWNRKEERKGNWTCVVVVSNDYNKERLKWCREYPSNGRFYRYYGNSNWWFEYPEDAVMFAMKWS